jgi:hypothetical protein
MRGRSTARLSRIPPAAGVTCASVSSDLDIMIWSPQVRDTNTATVAEHAQAKLGRIAAGRVSEIPPKARAGFFERKTLVPEPPAVPADGRADHGSISMFLIA